MKQMIEKLYQGRKRNSLVELIPNLLERVLLYLLELQFEFDQQSAEMKQNAIIVNRKKQNTT